MLSYLVAQCKGITFVQRKSNGNMTTLVSLTFGLVILVWLLGTVVNGLLFQRSRDLQNTDALSVTLANKLNEGNRIGQINELQAGSRELVYVSREQFEQCLNDEPMLSALADQLLTEARTNHQLVENERANIAAATAMEVKDAVSAINKESSSHAQFLPWLSAKNFQIQDVKFGRSKNALSNVPAFEAYPELLRYDAAQGYVDRASGLFLPEILAQLPVDADLRFPFAALPACVKGTCAPARLINDEMFVESTKASGRALSTALQLVSGSEVAVPNSSEQGQLKVRSTALTAGASPSEW